MILKRTYYTSSFFPYYFGLGASFADVFIVLVMSIELTIENFVYACVCVSVCSPRVLV